jgi:hypothetical protein
MIARRQHAIVAVLAFAAIVLQVIIAVRVPGRPHDVSTGLLRGSTLPGRIIRVFSFFTVLSKLLSGIVSAQLAVRPDRDGPVWRVIRLAALVGITVTALGVVVVLGAVAALFAVGDRKLPAAPRRGVTALAGGRGAA